MKKYVQCVQNVNAKVTPQETIYAIKNAGFDGAFIQWYNEDWTFSQQEQLELCKSLGLEIPFVHLGYNGINNIWLEGEAGDNLVNGFLNDLNVCSKNDIYMVIIHVSSKAIAPEPNLVGVKRFQTIVDYAEKLNIKVAFENGRREGYLEYILKHIKNKNAGVCFDVGHCHCYFKDKFNWDVFKNKIFAIHLHDNDGTSDSHLLPFDGTINWDDLSKNLKKANYNGPITLESCYRNDYLNISLEEFYNLSLERAKKI